MNNYLQDTLLPYCIQNQRDYCVGSNSENTELNGMAFKNERERARARETEREKQNAPLVNYVIIM